MQLSEQFEKLIFQNGQTINLSKKISANYTNKIHWHPFIEMLLCLDSVSEITVNFDTYRLVSNDIILLQPGDLHAINNHSEDSFLLVQFPLSLLSTFNEMGRLLRILSKHPLIRYTPQSSESDRLILEFKSLFDLNDSEIPFRELLISSKLLSFFGMLGQRILSAYPGELSSQETSQYKSARQIAEACIYISQNCSNPLTLENVSLSLGISKSYFAHLFKNYTKMTFIDFLTTERIKKSESLFINSQKKIIDIAFECGFTSISSFNRAFKKIKGISPTEFRKISIAETE